jgi:hypothetical protein
LDGIISLNIPLNKKLKLLGDLKFGKNRAKVDLSKLGKKYGIDLGEEVYKDKYLSPGLGAEYTTDEGTKFNFMVNPEDKGGSVSVSRSLQPVEEWVTPMELNRPQKKTHLLKKLLIE